MSDYKVTIKVQNNNILKRITDAGYKSVSEFCRLNPRLKGSSGSLGSVINMKESPLTIGGDFRGFIQATADVLLCSPEDLFTEGQINAQLETNKRTIDVSEAEMKFALQHDVDRAPDALVYQDEINNILSGVVDALTPREAKVIRLRYGLEGEEHTLEQCANHFDVTRERIRQIEAKALRKLRHPSRHDALRNFDERM